MKPSEIQSLLKQAQALRAVEPSGIHTFALYWITWEAYRTRMLAVAARLRGWKIEDAYTAIGSRRISTQKTYKQCFKAATDVQLAEQRGLLGKVIKCLDEIEALRHRLVHGYRSASPELITAANRFLDTILTHHEQVFGQLLLPLQDGTQIPLGNVLSHRPGSTRKIPLQSSLEALRECFGLNDSHQPEKLSHQSIIQASENVVSRLTL
jgi:hypothetical protein